MQLIFDSIEKAAAAGHCLPAIITALTIPDIAGAVDWPENGPNDRYPLWLDHWFSPEFPQYGRCGVDSMALYALRCKMLHEGRSNPSAAAAAKRSTAAAQLKLIAFNVGPGIFAHCNSCSDANGNVQVMLRAEQFCFDICRAGRTWLNHARSDMTAMERIATLIDVRKEIPGLVSGISMLAAAI